MAYNEEKGVKQLLNALIREKSAHINLKEIIVVASGCTDKTEAVVRDFSKRDSRVRLIAQSHREGKASAINLFLRHASGDIIVLESADTVPDAGALEKLVGPFDARAVGMTGARPVPIDRPDSFMGYAVNLMWSLHHFISLTTPKLGEMVAFRNIVRKIPEDTAVDEASIEALVTQAGYKLQYVPEAIVRNKGPDSIRDFVRQRRRIAAGHQHLARKYGYCVSTVDSKRILKLLIHYPPQHLRQLLWTLGACFLEVTARILGTFDVYLRKHVPVVWDIAPSTKSWN